MNTLLLDVLNWDLVLDAHGNIAMASNPYSLAQDAASAIRTFSGECWYDTTLGVPYWSQILGFPPPPIPLMKHAFKTAALTVPEVVAAQSFLQGIGTNRRLTGQVQVTARDGAIAAASF